MTDNFDGEYDIDLTELGKGVLRIKKRIQPVPTPGGFPARTESMFYYQHGDMPLPLWQHGEQPPIDGSLHLNVANSIGTNYAIANTSKAGTVWDNMPGEQGKAMRLWLDHVYGEDAGTRVVFSRHGWKPLGLLPFKNRIIYTLMDFMTPDFPLGAPGSGRWLTWPFEYKAHNPFKGNATVQANVNEKHELIWAAPFAAPRKDDRQPYPLLEGKVHRLTAQINMFADPNLGRFQAWIDGVPVADIQGQMAMTTPLEYAGCGVFIPCLYSNMLVRRMDGYIPNMILSTAPIAA